MKTFTVIDFNKPSLFFTNCVGCILEPKKYDQIVIYTESGEHYNVGPQMLHDLCSRLYEKILKTAEVGGSITVPNMDGMDDDQLRVAIEQIAIENK